MANPILGMVELRRVVADVPDAWPDGTEVHVCLVCRPGLTTKDEPRTVDERIVIDNEKGRNRHNLCRNHRAESSRNLRENLQRQFWHNPCQKCPTSCGTESEPK